MDLLIEGLLSLIECCNCMSEIVQCKKLNRNVQFKVGVHTGCCDQDVKYYLAITCGVSREGQHLHCVTVLCTVRSLNR